MVGGEVNISNEGQEIAISLIAQYLFCSRRAGLIALYGEWDDNEHTVAGTLEHERVHEAGVVGCGTIETHHALRVRSERLGLVGLCDRVDLELDTGKYIPIEFKHGKRRNEIEYEAQLCAQAICLEEMFHCDIPIGYLYFVTEKRRKEVLISEGLRDITMTAVAEIREMNSSGILPRAVLSAKCRGCSLRGICVPQSQQGQRAAAYVKQVLAFARGGSER